MVKDQVYHELKIGFYLRKLLPIAVTRVDCRIVDHAKAIIRAVREKREYV